MEPVLILFSLILVGVVVKKLGIVSDNMNREVSSLVINVCLPAFILKSMQFDFAPEVLLSSGTLIATSFAVYALSIVLSMAFIRLIGVAKEQRNVYQYVGVFSNTGYMGYPVLYAFAGDLGVFYGAVYNLAFSVLVWSYGVSIMSKSSQRESKGLWDSIKAISNPALWAVLIGLSLFTLGIQLPAIVQNILGLIGATTTPLSMMFIGFILSDLHPKDLVRHWRDFAIAGLRLMIIPALVFGILTLVGMEGELLAVPVLIAAMPAAANTAILANRYGADDQLASRIIFITTLLSVGTVPLVLQFLPKF